MKKLAMLLAVAALVTSCAKKTDNTTSEQAIQEATRAELESAIADRDQLLGLVNEISSNMDQIKRLENILTVGEGSSSEVGSQRSQIEADIAAIQATLQQRREQLAQLEERLNRSNLNNKNLQATITALNNQIKNQEDEIASLTNNLTEARRQIGSLTETVDSLNTTVSTVTDERNIAQQEVEDVTAELNTCYYVAANKSELKEHKIIETGFLRKTKLLKGDFDQSFFQTANKQTLTTLNLHSNKAEVKTNHPADSYRLDDVNGSKVLRILDPAKFWSLTNYLVIQID